MAAGITNAFRDVELLAEAIDQGFAARQPIEETLGDYERRRDALAMPIYDFACETALFEPATLQMQELFAALKNNQSETNRFFGLLA
jgi:2-polyprenyl-6-methoxyphenol hydroxylase-like FAD-dependent oxidoreductase